MSDDQGMSVATHPRAPGSIQRIRARSALAGAVLVGIVAARAGLPASSVVSRALLASVIGYLAGWAVAVAFWREIVKLELRAAVRRKLARRR